MDGEHFKDISPYPGWREFSSPIGKMKAYRTGCGWIIYLWDEEINDFVICGITTRNHRAICCKTIYYEYIRNELK